MHQRKYRVLLRCIEFSILALALRYVPVSAQEGDRIAQRFLHNVVELTVTFSDDSIEHGFGFVVGERANSLFVVTARHVVRSDEPDVATTRVQVRFYADQGRAYPAELLNLSYRSVDLALLDVGKPFESYAWEPQYYYLASQRGDRVWFIGRNQDWWWPTDSRAGEIEETPLMGDLPVSMSSVLPGTSGAPIFTQEGIVGMIIEDSPEQVVVLDIGIIRQIVAERWSYPWGLEEFQGELAPELTATSQPTPTPIPPPEPATPKPTQPADNPPSIAVVSEIPDTIQAAELKIAGLVSDDRGIDTFDIQVSKPDSRLLAERPRVQMLGEMFEAALPLAVGQNVIVITAIDTSGQSSQKEFLVTRLEPPTPPEKEIIPQPNPTPTVIPTTVLTPISPKQGDEWTEPATGMEFVWIEGGCFQMGCVSNRECRPDETPVHQVCLDGFWMGKYEVTQAQWKLIMGETSTVYDGDTLPMERVSWTDAQKFVERVNAHAGEQRFRLPSEAQWEYATRAGTQSRHAFGNDAAQVETSAWHLHNSDEKTHPVGVLRPNSWGLYDIHGNVAEWCADWYGSGYYSESPQNNPEGPESGDYRVFRGGGWECSPEEFRAALRNYALPDDYNGNLGFRVVKILPKEEEPPQTVQESGHQFTLNACALDDRMIVCDFVIVTERDTKIILNADSANAQSKIIDACGNEYDAAWVQIGNSSQSADRQEDLFYAGIPKKVRLAFEQVALPQNRIAVLLIAAYGVKSGEYSKFPFRAITLGRESSEPVMCPSPVTEPVENERRSYAVRGCSRTEQTVVCDILVTPKRDEFIVFDAAASAGQSQLFDASDNEYDAARVRIGGMQSAEQFGGRFFADLPRKVTLIFENFPLRDDRISGLLLAGYGSGELIRVTFRNIPISPHGTPGE